VPQLGAIGPPPGLMLTELPARRRTRIAYRNGTRHQPPVSACIAAIHAASHGVGPHGVGPDGVRPDGVGPAGRGDAARD
jgi:hypothetical protein